MIGFVLLGLLGVAVVALAIWFYSSRVRPVDLEQASRLFHQRREWLEAEFLSRASHSGRPRGLAWHDCEFENEVVFARERQTKQLRALVPVTIQFRAVVGGGMEEVAAVGNLRSATAVFRFNRGAWETDGRAVFNLSPHETIRHFAHELEPA